MQDHYMRYTARTVEEAIEQVQHLEAAGIDVGVLVFGVWECDDGDRLHAHDGAGCDVEGGEIVYSNSLVCTGEGGPDCGCGCTCAVLRPAERHGSQEIANPCRIVLTMKGGAGWKYRREV